MTWPIFFALLAVLIIWVIATYNSLIRLIEEIRNNKNQIDVQLDRRFKVYSSLIEVVKKYMDYEQTTLKQVVELRTLAQKAATTGDTQAQIKAEEGISKIGSGLNLIFENYPVLKADGNARQLQEEIVSTENKLTFAKQAYNDSVERYTATCRSLLQSFLVKAFSRQLKFSFSYWGLTDGDREQHENYTVKF